MRVGSVRVRAVALALVAALAAAGLVLGLMSGVFGSWARGGLYATGLWTRNGPSTLPVSPASTRPTTPPPTPSLAASLGPAPGLPAPVLAAADPGRAPDAAKVAARIRAVQVKGSGLPATAAVLDVGSGRTLFSRSPDRLAIPASTTKLLTSAAVLSVLGPERTFTTRVVNSRPGQIVLVGGGDPYLSGRTAAGTFPQRASVVDLAQATAAALRKTQVRRVSLGYDDSLFVGPRWHPSWPAAYADQVTPVSSLWVDEGRANGRSPGPRVANPSLRAAQAFAAALSQQGITVTATAPARAKPPAPVLASVQSMPLACIVEQLLLTSDNDAAEVVLRHGALGADRPGSFADGAAVIRDQLTRLGVWAPGTRVVDGSGLSRQTQVSAETMVELLRLAAGQQHPELRALITGLPVAGVEGSLRMRFFDDQSLAGRGVVRGKTGTLRKVNSLAGFVRARDGSMLVYAFLFNDPENDYAARVWLDRASAALSSCGCR